MFFWCFFLSGKRTSCSYLPDSRVKKDISRKNIKFQNLLKKEDSLVLLNAIKLGNINFSKSNTSLKKCKEYYFEQNDSDSKIWLIVKNCKNSAIIISYNISEN